MKPYLKRYFTIMLIFAIIFTMIPINIANAASDEGKAVDTIQITTNDNGTNNSVREKKPHASYSFVKEDLTDKTIEDTSGNGFHGTLMGDGAAIQDDALMLPGGAKNSKAAYVSIPGEVFAGQDTLTINVWLKNQTGSNNYAAMFFGTKTKHVDSASAAETPLNYWLLNPAQPDGYFKSVWTNSNNSDAPYKTETAVSKTKTGSDWAMYTTVITPDRIIGYYNGEEVCNNQKAKTTTDFGNDLVAFLGRSSYNDMYYKGGIYGVAVYTEAFTKEDIQNEYCSSMPSELVVSSLDKIKKNLEVGLGDLTGVTENLDLPTQGENKAEISWSSSKPEVIANDGTVARPETVDTEVTLTATIKLGGKTATITFKVKVISTSKKSQLDLQVKHLAIDSSILTDDIALPSGLDENTKLTWSSSDTEVLNVQTTGGVTSAVVTRPEKGAEDVQVELKADIIYDDGTDRLEASKTFAVTVRAQDYGSLMAYTNSKESASLGSSLHLAYSKDFENFTALNSNTGVCFAKNIGGAKNTNPNGLQSMCIFRKVDGTYGMIARNVSKQNYLYVFDSADLVHFTNERKLALNYGADGSLEVDQCEYDGSTVTYEIFWSDGTKNYHGFTKDFVTVFGQEETDYQPGTDYQMQSVPDGAVITSVIDVSKTEYEKVVNKLDVVRNTGIEEVSVTVGLGDDLPTLPQKVTAEYNDGSTADMGVEWDVAELAKVDLNKEGTYVVTGTVKQTQYVNPFIEQRADPCILKGDDGYYYFTASYPVKGSGEGYDRIVLRRSQTIEGLAQAEEVTVWHCNDAADEFRYIWAPEIRLVKGQYYIFYTSSVESKSVWGIRPHVLKCTNSEDMMNPGSWQAMGKMQKVESDSIAFTGFSLDMTVFENQGRWYVIWAQADDGSCLFLAEINPDEPWKCISESVKISLPEYSWERQAENVNEGPSVIKNNGKIYVAFSASGTGPEYCVGLLSIDETADMLDKDAWEKQPYPVLTSSDVPGEYGPGHNSFTVDEDGNPIFVYHARGQECYENKCEWASSSSLNDPCRDARLKRVHWSADGTPILKMNYEDELAKENCTVTAVIKVEEDHGSGSVVEDITLNKNSLTLEVGESETLKATILPEDAANQEVSWSSSDKNVATVENGNVTAKKEGTATITVASQENPSIKKTCMVTVKAAATTTPVDKVELNKTKLTLNLGKTYKLTATISPKDATNKDVSWKSSQSSVVSVTSKGTEGIVKAKKIGSATITVTVNGDKKKTATCKVTVKRPVSKVTLNKTKLTMGVKETFTLKATVKPKNATNKKVSWKTKNKKIVTVKNGKLTAKKKGTATITATVDGKKVTCKVTVKPAPTKKAKVTLNKKKVSLKVKKTFQIKPKVSSKFGSATFKYSIDKKGKKIVKVDKNGKVTAKKKGKATITVKTYNGKAKATLKVTVK